MLGWINGDVNEKWLFSLDDGEKKTWSFPSWENPVYMNPCHRIHLNKESIDDSAVSDSIYCRKCGQAPPEAFLNYWKMLMNLKKRISDF